MLESALAYVDRYGLAGLTMRRLGTELGVEGMSLYKHVDDKDALLAGIVELLWVEVPAAPPGADWHAALRELGDGLREVFHRHPNTAPLLVTRSFINVEALRCYETYLNVLQRVGFDRRRAHEAIGAVIGQGLGFALLELRCVGPDPELAEQESEIGRIRWVTRSLPVDVPESLVELGVELAGECDRDRCFAISMDALLGGLSPEPADR